jgi:acyl-CoA thioester hydrolase
MPQTDPSLPDLAADGAYRRWTDVTIRYSDQDGMGHVNNTAYAAYVEAARTRLLFDLAERFPAAAMDFTLVHLSIDYRNEAFYPGTVRVGGRMMRVGTKSLATAYGVFLDGRCLATAECVNVGFDRARRASRPIPDDMRRFIEDEIASQDAAAGR